MFGKVIVGVDGRPAGRDAVALARVLVDPDGALILAHVHAGEAFASRASNLDFDAVQRDDSLRLLEEERKATETSNRADLLCTASASVGAGLHHLVEQQQADLLVVGSCHRGFVGRVLMGNDTRAALNGAPCAVAIAPLGYAREMAAITDIGVGYDGSPESQAALRCARELAHRRNATLRALEVVQIPTSPYVGFAAAAWGETLDDLVKEAQTELDQLGGVEGEAVLGLAGEELSEFCSRIDLLVVGSRGYGPLRRLMLGSTSAHLVGHARCPLVVLPRAASVGATADEPEQSAASAS